MRSITKRQTPFRLMILLIIFLLLLLIPSGILIWQSYHQLKWEAFYRYRLMAEELVARMDQSFLSIVASKNTLAFTDFAFLNVTGDARANPYKRSQLSEFPVEESIPGLIGYFQIDHEGNFSTPLLPGSSVNTSDYGISAQELSKRQAEHQKIYDLLKDNALIKGIRKTEVPGLLSSDASRTGEPDVIDLSDDAPVAVSAFTGIGESVGELESTSQLAFDKLAESKELYLKRGKKPDVSDETKPFPEKDFYDETENKSVTSQEKGEDSTYAGSLNEVQAAISSLAGARDSRRLRKEQNVLPEITVTAQRTEEAEKRDQGESPGYQRVEIFESEIEPFDFSVLDTGHYLLYRKVWKDRERYIQGMLLSPEVLLGKIIGQTFRGSEVSHVSNLAVTFQGIPLIVLSMDGQALSETRMVDEAGELKGASLLNSRLSYPFNQLELTFNINRLNYGPAATLLIWTSVTLFGVLLAGFFMMYRLGSGQIRLAQQQQDFVSAVSHELKTPLTSIRLYGEMLREGWAEEEKKIKYYTYIHDESERLTRLINNVLQLSKINRQSLKPDSKPMVIDLLMNLLVEKSESQLRQAGFSIELDIEPDISKTIVLIDEDYVSQIFINLVDNAIKYSARAETKRVEIRCSWAGKTHVQIAVRDYGPGIAGDQMHKIFRLFYRVGSELTRETVGTGIGLALAKELVGAMNGKIDVVNRSPGAEFRMVFPVSLQD